MKCRGFEKSGMSQLDTAARKPNTDRSVEKRTAEFASEIQAMIGNDYSKHSDP